MKLFIIATILLISYVALDLVYDQWLWDVNTNVTIMLQKNQFDGEILFFRIVSYMLFVAPIFAVAGFLFLDQKMEILLYGIVVIATSNINSSLKLIYHQPRPFMVSDQIQALECIGEFGKPSGHAMISSCLVFLLPAILYPGIYRVQSDRPNYRLHVRISALFIMSMVVILTGLSRVFLGVHSIGQILLGWVYTTYIIVIYINYIHYPTKQYLLHALKRGGQGLSNKFLTYLTIFQIFWILWNLMWQLLDKDIYISNNQLEIWLRAVENCYGYAPQSLNKNSPQILYNICFIQTQVFGFVYGCCIGIKQSKGIVIENTFSLNYRNINNISKFYRILIILLLISLLVPFLFMHTEQTYIQAFIQIYLMTFQAGIILMYMYPTLLKQFKLNIEGDFVFIENEISRNVDDQEIQMVKL